MGCCDQKSLKRVTNYEDAIIFAITEGKLLLIHKDDIASYSSDGTTLSVSLVLGYTKEFTKGQLINFDDVIDQLTNALTRRGK